MGTPEDLLPKLLTYEEAEALPEFAELAGYLMVCRPSTRDRIKALPIVSAVSNSGSKVAQDRILRGLERVREVVRSGTSLSLRIWDEAECREDATRSDVRLFRFPACSDGSRGPQRQRAPWVLIIPGGGYQSVCNAFEGFPAAAELNLAGYSAFVLSYRVRMDGLMPRPIDDVARAVDYVRSHAVELGVGEGAPYAVMGFSAGGHLAAEWGTTNHGYRVYDQLKPAALILCYAPIDVRLSLSSEGERNPFVRSLIGGRNLEKVGEYSVNLHMDDEYPETFIWQCRDDEVVSIENLEIMQRRLAELGIPHEALEFGRGGHALMKPHDEESDNWMSRVLPFLRERLG